MKTEHLVSCLRECEAKVRPLPRGNLAVYLAYENGESKALVVGGNPTFTRLLVEGRKIYPELMGSFKRVSSSLTAPHLGVVHSHLLWMIEEFPKLGDGEKQHRWFGFIDGTLDYQTIMLSLTHPWTRANWERCSDESAVDLSMDQLVMCAIRGHGSYRDHQLIAHYALGYLQGVLWRGGVASIDDLRIMSKPPEEAFRKSA